MENSLNNLPLGEMLTGAMQPMLQPMLVEKALGVLKQVLTKEQRQIVCEQAYSNVDEAMQDLHEFLLQTNGGRKALDDLITEWEKHRKSV